MPIPQPRFGRRPRPLRLFLGLRGVIVPVWIAVCLSLVVLTAPAPAQLSLPLPSSQAVEDALPAGVVRADGFDSAPVQFENGTLFRIAAPAGQNRAETANPFLVDVRARQIETNLQQIIAPDSNWDLLGNRTYSTAFDPQSIEVEIATLNRQTVLIARDRLRSQELLTVTSTDAQYYRLPLATLAEQWQQILQARLKLALDDRLPATVARQKQKGLWIFASVVVCSGLLLLLQRWVGNRRNRLESSLAANRQAASTTLPPRDRSLDPPHFGPNSGPNSGLSEPVSRNYSPPPVELAPPDNSLQGQWRELIQDQFTLERRRLLLTWLEWLLFWGQGLLWLGGLAWILHLFSATRAIAILLWTRVAVILAIGFMVGLFNRAGDLLITHFANAWDRNAIFTFEDAQRRSMRISTITRATRGFKTFMAYTLGILWGLNALGVSTGSVLTVGAVLALAISFASQNLIKDLVNGFLILCEDQYAIGDVIAIGQVSGLVENLNLRITQLRNAEGRLITIPNSLISQVENLTRTWSRIDFALTVAYNADIQHAIAVIKTVAETLYHDPAWRSLLPEPPEVLGVDDISHEGVLIRVWIKTQPLQQWRVGREFRLRIRLALEEHGIEIGSPQQVILHRNEWIEDDFTDSPSDGQPADKATPRQAIPPDPIANLPDHPFQPLHRPPADSP